MKKLTMKVVIGLAALLAGMMAQAQTNLIPPVPQSEVASNTLALVPEKYQPTVSGGIAEIEDALAANPTNYAIAVVGGRKLSGNADAACLLAVYNISGSGFGVVAGMDHLWSPNAAPDTSVINGGFQYKYAQKLPSIFGSWTTNYPVNIFGITLVGTPVNGTTNNGGLESCNRIGGYEDLIAIKNFELSIGAAFGNRTGTGAAYDGNWVDVFLAGHVGFKDFTSLN